MTTPCNSPLRHDPFVTCACGKRGYQHRRTATRLPNGHDMTDHDPSNCICYQLNAYSQAICDCACHVTEDVPASIATFEAAMSDITRALAHVVTSSAFTSEAVARLNDVLRYSPAERRRRARRRARLAAKNPTSTALWTQYRAKTRRRNRKARR